METLKEILKPMSKARRDSLESLSKLSPREIAELKIKSINEEEGDLHLTDGYVCETCKNKGYIIVLEEEPPYKEGGAPTYREVAVDCKCKKIRASIRRMKRSGLEATIRKCTFDKYEAEDEWQQNLLVGAKKFASEVDELADKWFFMGGAVGSGKTHLCTAIARELLLQGKELRYMLWIDESTKLKGCINDDQYADLIYPLKNAEVLYIDDLFKLPPTSADIKLAYEIINYRYQNPKLITIISSERYISEIEEIDSAIGSRIYEKTKNHAFNIGRDSKRNYRTKDMVTI